MEDIKFNLNAIDNTFTTYKVNEMVDGVVVLKKEDSLIINIGGKKDAVVPLEEVRDFNEIKIGDRFKVVVIKKQNEEGQVVASKNIADDIINGNQSAESIKIGKIFTCVITSVKPEGLVSKLGEYEIIVPNDEICSYRKVNPKSYISKQIEAVALEVDKKDKKIVASIKIPEDQIRTANETAFWRVIFENKIVSGTVKRFMPYGAFVDVDGVDCLLHISDISHERILAPEEKLELGKKYQFKVIRVDKENKKVSLGLKQLEDTKKLQAIKSMKIGDKFTGEAIKILAFGAIIKLNNDAEGLLHISDATEDRRKSIHEIVKLGEKIEVYVKAMDLDRERISLSLTDPTI